MGSARHTSPRVLSTLYACVFQCLHDLAGDLGTPGRIVLDFIALWWEAVVIVQQIMLTAAGDGDFVRRPMRGDKNDSFGCLWGAQFEDLRQLGLERLDDVAMAGVAQKWHRTAAMRQRDHRGEACHVAGVRRQRELLDT